MENFIRGFIFAENQLSIEAHNKDFEAGKTSFTVGQNEFSASTPDELKKLRGRVRSIDLTARKVAEPFPVNILKGTFPKELDYRKTPGMLNQVEQQG